MKDKTNLKKEKNREIYIVKRKKNERKYRPVLIAAETLSKLETISKESGIAVWKIADQLINVGMKDIVIVDEEDLEEEND